ncbi:hypothetical protein LCGC14_1977760 [marine sediment metagenome]|uniref:Uncharacterized protein n=1 Tax=marine sediment metagenome TaxID=412755 RepID=A0A0F9I6U0_9ZZZZ
MAKWQHALLIVTRIAGAILIALSLPYAQPIWPTCTMTQPGSCHRIFFALLLSTLLMALPEVITMNDPIPWIQPML